MVTKNFYHDEKKVRSLNMRTKGRAQYNGHGDLKRAAIFQGTKAPAVQRIKPNRKWFTDTRVISQNEIDDLKESKIKTPYEILIKVGKIPIQLNEPKIGKRKIIFEKLKKPRIYKSIEEILDVKEAKKDEYDKTQGLVVREERKGFALKEGQSRRIWSEFYKVLDSSDVVIHVLDARDPIGTKCDLVKKYIDRKDGKNIIYLLNKADLVPADVTAKWCKHITQNENSPCIVFYAPQQTHFYGRMTLVNLIRQYQKLLKKPIAVGFVGFPNVGKSSVINVLRAKSVCPVAPVPGQTKVWQYIKIGSNISLIDCPGVVVGREESVLKGSVRIENIDDPEKFLIELWDGNKSKFFETYGAVEDDCTEWLNIVCKKMGRLTKGGEPDTNTVCRIILRDWLKGKIPWYNKLDENNICVQV